MNVRVPVNAVITGDAVPFGTAGFSGDGGPTAAAVCKSASPANWLRRDLLSDRIGNLFIGDIGNHRVRKVSPDGVITTVEWGTYLRGRARSGLRYWETDSGVEL